VETFGIHGTRLELGQAEIGILLPRELFQNHLRELIDELRTLNRVIRAFSEVATGAPEPIEVHQISTSDPVFFFGISATTIAFFGKAVRWALNTWKQVEEIKKVRADAQRIRAFTDKEMKDIFDTKIDESIKNAIETHVKELLPPDKSEPRHHELRNDLVWALDSILTRVERGMTVEIRFLPPAATADAEAKTVASADFETLAQIAPELKFPPPEGAPVRPLPPPEPPSQSV
jgi:hypothetical protein